MPATGSTKNTPRTAKGKAARAATPAPERQRRLIGGSSTGDVAPLAQPGVAVIRDVLRRHGVGLRGGLGELRPGRRQRCLVVDGVDVHVVRECLLERPL